MAWQSVAGAWAAGVAVVLAGGVAQACPSGPRPTANDARYIAACANDDDHVVLIRPSSGDDAPGFAVSAVSSGPTQGGMGVVAASAAVAATAKFLFNPDLHASVIGEVNSTATTNDGGDGYAMASFRDIITFNGKFSAHYWTMDYTLDGILAATHVSGDAAYGVGLANLNLGIEKLDDSAVHAGNGLSLDTEEGNIGSITTALSVGMDVLPATPYILRGDLDVRAYGEAGAGLTATFASDFGSTAQFAGFHFYTDSTMTTEVFDVTVQSAFGFDYSLDAPITNGVPEPGSLAVLGTALGALGLRRRRWSRA